MPALVPIPPTAALMQVGECLPWSAGGSSLSYTRHNHNSVLGLRELALRGGAEVHVVDFKDYEDAPATSAAEGPSAATSTAADVLPVAEAPAIIRGLPGEMVHCHSMRRRMGPALPKGVAEHARDGRGSADAGALAADDSGGSGSGSDGGSGGRAGASTKGTCSSGSDGGSDGRSDDRSDDRRIGPSFRLLALPLECNFSGRRYDLGAAMAASAGAGPSGNPSSCSGSGSGSGAGSGSCEARSLVLVDAAKACATSPPDLSVHPVDFIALSYYKIFG